MLQEVVHITQVEKRMVPLSKDTAIIMVTLSKNTAIIILQFDIFGNHLDGGNKTIDQEFEIKKTLKQICALKHEIFFPKSEE